MSENKGLFSLLILFEGRENGVMLWYRSFAAAQAASERLFGGSASADDFGHWMSRPGTPISGMMITEIDRELEVQTDMALRNARAQASANARANADPGLNFARANRSPGLVG